MLLNELMCEIDVSAVVTYEENGLSTLDFSLPSDHELIGNMLPETEVTYHNVYKIQTLHDYDENTEFTCGFKLYELKSELITISENEKNLSYYLGKILEGTPWNITNESKTKNKRTIEMENVYRIDALQELQDVFDVYMEYDNLKKTITVTDIDSYENKGKYISEQVNCLSIDYQSDSNNIATRIYGYGGKDALDQVITVESINDGKPYVENFDYTDEVIEYKFTDERFMNKQNLLLEMKKRLKVMSRPTESYDIRVIDLAKCSEMYAPLKLNLHELVSLYDRKRNRVVEHRIVKYEEHIGNPEEDVVTLNCVLPTPESVINDTNKQIEIIQNINDNVQSDIQKVEAAMYYYTNTTDFTISTILKQFSSFEFKTSSDANLLLHASFNIEGTGSVEVNIYIDDTLMKFKPKEKIDTNGVISFTYPTLQLEKGTSHFLEIRLITDSDATMKIAAEQGHVVLYGQKLVGGLSDSRPHAEITEFVYKDQFETMNFLEINDNALVNVQNFINVLAPEYITDYMMQEISADMIKASASIALKQLGYIIGLSLTDFDPAPNYVLDGSIRYQSEDVLIPGEPILQDQDIKVTLLDSPDTNIFYYVGKGEIING